MKLTKDTYFKFNGGEVHVKLNPNADVSRIVCLDYTMNGFMALCELKEILGRKGYNAIHLTYPYLPYARQDRVMEENEPFSLKVFCNLLNSQNFASVTTWDPHSDVAPALINNCKVATQWGIAGNFLPKEYWTRDDVVFVSPDAGAYKKVSKLMTDDSKIIVGVKKRNASGQITHTEILGDPYQKVCVIVDDICDGGRTFVELAKALVAKGAAKVILYVTHGIFSNGFDELRQHIDHIYTTNSFPQTGGPDFLTVKALI